jgi:excisionase family DNA binding protein
MNRPISSALYGHRAYGTVPEAVMYSGLSRSAVYAALRRGKLKASKAGRRTLIRFSDLDEYLAALPPFQASR